jgi:hypothetical protein
VVPTVLWFARNSILLGDPSERDIAWHPPGAESLRQTVESLSAWTIGDGRWGLLLLLPVLGLFLAARPLLGRMLQASARMQIAVTGAGAYLALLLGSRALVDANIALDIRLLAPMHLFVLIALAALLDAAPTDTGLGRHRLLLSITGAGLLVGAVGGVDHAGDLSGQEGSGYAARRWTGSEGVAYIEALRDDTTVVTNAPDAAWLLADHGSLLFLPVGRDLYTGGPNLRYDAQLDALATTLRDRPGAVVVYFDRPTRSRSRWLDDDTRKALGLTFVANVGDATVWDVRGG